MGAREFFLSVYASAEEVGRTRRTLARMRSHEGLRGGIATGSSSGSHADSMRPTDERMDFEERMRARLETDRAIIDEATAIIYGSKAGTGGVAALLGTATADTLWWRYCMAKGWHEVSWQVERSESWCRTHVGLAFDLIDSLGAGAVKAGDGGADW